MHQNLQIPDDYTTSEIFQFLRERGLWLYIPLVFLLLFVNRLFAQKLPEAPQNIVPEEEEESKKTEEAQSFRYTLY